MEVLERIEKESKPDEKFVPQIPVVIVDSGVVSCVKFRCVANITIHTHIYIQYSSSMSPSISGSVIPMESSISFCNIAFNRCPSREFVRHLLTVEVVSFRSAHRRRPQS